MAASVAGAQSIAAAVAKQVGRAGTAGATEGPSEAVAVAAKAATEEHKEASKVETLEVVAAVPEVAPGVAVLLEGSAAVLEEAGRELGRPAARWRRAAVQREYKTRPFRRWWRRH